MINPMISPLKSAAERGVWTFLMLAAILFFVAACASNKPYQIELMPAPDVYMDGTVNPFQGIEDIPDESMPYNGILYATDRKPSNRKDLFYANERGFLLRLGIADIILGKNTLDWEEARRISLLKNRSNKYPLKLTSVEEIGILDRSVSEWQDPAILPPDLNAPAETFAEKVNAKLKISRRKEIMIYVHGYKVVFENPLLVATELWHFLGYDGVFIAYAWPSTPSVFAYISDLETAEYTTRNLRLFLEYLAEETNAERIHLIGYSAGTRVVISSLVQLALEHKFEDKKTVQNT